MVERPRTHQLTALYWQSRLQRNRSWQVKQRASAIHLERTLTTVESDNWKRRYGIGGSDISEVDSNTNSACACCLRLNQRLDPYWAFNTL